MDPDTGWSTRRSGKTNLLNPARGGMSRMFPHSRGLPRPALRAAAAPVPEASERSSSNAGDGFSGSGSAAGGGSSGSRSFGSATISAVAGVGEASGPASSGTRIPEIRMPERVSGDRRAVAKRSFGSSGGLMPRDKTNAWTATDTTMQARRARWLCLRRVSTLAGPDATGDTACRSPQGKVLPRVPPPIETPHSLDPIRLFQSGESCPNDS